MNYTKKLNLCQDDKFNEMSNNNKNQIKNLMDKTKNGNERPWKEKKINNIKVSNSYRRLMLKFPELSNKAYNLENCATYLEFKKYQDNSLKLSLANFCKVRLCPMCAWRRSLKIFSQVSKVMNVLEQEKNCKFIFLTLTCENINSDELNSQLDLLSKSFIKLFKRKDVKQSIKGYFRALEITHDTNKYITKDMYYGNQDKHLKSRAKYYKGLGLRIGDLNPNFNKYHPHYHCILVVNKSYFTDVKFYLSQNKWTSLWQESLNCDYVPIVDVRKLKNNSNKEISEVAKYTVKDNDYITHDDNLTDETVYTLDLALRNRRLVGFSGVFKEIHKELNLKDLDNDDDLIHIDDDEEMREDLEYELVTYKWNVGYSNYIC